MEWYVKPALELLRELREAALGENPQGEQVEQFNGSLQGQMLNVLEQYFVLFEAGTPPYYVVGEPQTLFLSDMSPDRSVGLSVSNKYTICASEDGSIELRAPYSGGDDWLLYGVAEELGSLTIDAKSGEFLPKVSPEALSRLQAILRLTERYYAALGETASSAQEYFQLAGYVPSNLLPQFPREAIQQLRGMSP